MLRSCELRVSGFNRFMASTGATLTRQRKALERTTV